MKLSRCLIFLLGLSSLLAADCTRPDRQHKDKKIVRCSYFQEDIFRHYSKKSNTIPRKERRKECFFCSCPIAEHEKREKQK
jgi:hypothetical protein